MSDDRKQQVLALGRLGWTLREIEEAVGGQAGRRAATSRPPASRCEPRVLDDGRPVHPEQWSPRTVQNRPVRQRGVPRLPGPDGAATSAVDADLPPMVFPDRRPEAFLRVSRVLAADRRHAPEACYLSTSETRVAVMARSSQRSKIVRSVQASMRASSSGLGVSCRPTSTRRRAARASVSRPSN